MSNWWRRRVPLLHPDGPVRAPVRVVTLAAGVCGLVGVADRSTTALLLTVAGAGGLALLAGRAPRPPAAAAPGAAFGLRLLSAGPHDEHGPGVVLQAQWNATCLAAVEQLSVAAQEHYAALSGDRSGRRRHAGALLALADRIVTLHGEVTAGRVLPGGDDGLVAPLSELLDAVSGGAVGGAAADVSALHAAEAVHQLFTVERLGCEVTWDFGRGLPPGWVTGR